MSDPEAPPVDDAAVVEAAAATVLKEDKLEEHDPDANVDLSKQQGGFRAFWASIVQIVYTREDYPSLGRLGAFLDNYFRISDRDSSIRTEFVGGMTTFFAMCYILALNGVIIGGFFGTGLPKRGVFFATAVGAALITTLMGALVNVPVGLAPGLGLNGVFAVIASAAPCWSENGLHKPFSTDKELFNAFKAMQDETLDTYLPTIGQSATLNAATGKYGGCSAWGKTNLPWTDAMGAVFISGWFYLFFTFTGLRSMMFKAVPKSLRASIAVGIGFFITIIGLKDGDVMRFSLANYVIPSVVAQSGCALSWGANYAAATNADFGFNVEYLYGDSASSTTSAGGHANCPPGSKAGDLGCPGIQFCSNAATLPNSAVTIGLSNLVAGTQAPFARITILGIVLVCIFVTLRIRSALILSIIFATLIGINYGAPIGQGNSLHTAGLTHVDGVNYKAGTGLVEYTGSDFNYNKTGFLQAVATSSSDVQAVTNLASWFAFSHNIEGSDAASMSTGTQRLQYSNHFFLPDLSVIPTGKLTFKYADKGIFWDAVWTFLFVELFDSFGTLTGIMTRAGYMKGNPEKAMQRVNRAMCIDGLGLWVGGLLGSNSITCYIESNTGIEAGARTGLASVVTGSMFFLSLLFVAPFVGIIPAAATTAALFMVGVYSLDGVRDIDFNDFSHQFPAFMAIATMAFTYSIANGICTSFIFYSLIMTTRWCWQSLATKTPLGLRFMKPYEEGLDCSLPHPLMLLFSAFMAVRFVYLEPGHQ